jgi:hypothetical protein
LKATWSQFNVQKWHPFHNAVKYYLMAQFTFLAQLRLI